MAEYKVRKLYQLGTGASIDTPESYESMWAYSVQYPGADHRTPGRFRIRITKMSAAEFVAMMGGEPADVETDGFSIQGFVEKWASNGWIHCLDWIGNPESEFKGIEQDLLDMFEAFTTGEPTEKNWSAPSPQPATPKNEQDLPKPSKKGKPKLDVIPGGKAIDGEDFDWI